MLALSGPRELRREGESGRIPLASLEIVCKPSVKRWDGIGSSLSSLPNARASCRISAPRTGNHVPIAGRTVNEPP